MADEKGSDQKRLELEISISLNATYNGKPLEGLLQGEALTSFIDDFISPAVREMLQNTCPQDSIARKQTTRKQSEVSGPNFQTQEETAPDKTERETIADEDWLNNELADMFVPDEYMDYKQVSALTGQNVQTLTCKARSFKNSDPELHEFIQASKLITSRKGTSFPSDVWQMILDRSADKSYLAESKVNSAQINSVNTSTEYILNDPDTLLTVRQVAELTGRKKAAVEDVLRRARIRSTDLELEYRTINSGRHSNEPSLLPVSVWKTIDRRFAGLISDSYATYSEVSKKTGITFLELIRSVSKLASNNPDYHKRMKHACGPAITSSNIEVPIELLIEAVPQIASYYPAATSKTIDKLPRVRFKRQTRYV